MGGMSFFSDQKNPVQYGSTGRRGEYGGGEIKERYKEEEAQRPTLPFFTSLTKGHPGVGSFYSYLVFSLS